MCQLTFIYRHFTKSRRSYALTGREDDKTKYGMQNLKMLTKRYMIQYNRGGKKPEDLNRKIIRPNSRTTLVAFEIHIEFEH
jgi:hypothetical protein